MDAYEDHGWRTDLTLVELTLLVPGALRSARPRVVPIRRVPKDQDFGAEDLKRDPRQLEDLVWQPL